jgi:hypothetical protein
MRSTQGNPQHRRVEIPVLGLLIGLILIGCGTSSPEHTSTAAVSPAFAPPNAVVVRVGATPITGAAYDHWMRIGAATVEMPRATGSLPTPIAYEPPDFSACVTHLQAIATKSTTAQLKAKCRHTYEGIQARILDFLITGYWLRGEATEQRVSLTGAQVRKKFDEEKRAGYPTAASFHRLEEASRQTVADLEFAVETQMLSATLLETFAKTHQAKSEQAMIAAFNTSIRSKWTPRTGCQPGYIVTDCSEYRRR